MLICPYTSHQNRTVERKHRKIVEVGLSLLDHASILIKYWDNNFTIIVYLINKLPTTIVPTSISPYVSLYNKKPGYVSLKVFGSSCFPLFRPYNQHKLQFCNQYMYLDVSPTYKGKKFLNIEGIIYISKDIKFNENEFPFNKLFSVTSNEKTKSINHDQTNVPFVLPDLNFTKRSKTSNGQSLISVINNPALTSGLAMPLSSSCSPNLVPSSPNSRYLHSQSTQPN